MNSSRQLHLPFRGYPFFPLFFTKISDVVAAESGCNSHSTSSSPSNYACSEFLLEATHPAWKLRLMSPGSCNPLRTRCAPSLHGFDGAQIHQPIGLNCGPRPAHWRWPQAAIFAMGVSCFVHSGPPIFHEPLPKTCSNLRSSESNNALMKPARKRMS